MFQEEFLSKPPQILVVLQNLEGEEKRSKTSKESVKDSVKEPVKESIQVGIK